MYADSVKGRRTYSSRNGGPLLLIVYIVYREANNVYVTDIFVDSIHAEFTRNDDREGKRRTRSETYTARRLCQTL